MLRPCPYVPPLVLLLLAIACDAPAPAPAVTPAGSATPASSAALPFKATVTTKQLMAEVLEPASNVYWEAVGSTTDARGTVDKAPRTDAEWNTVRDAATIVAESGNLLMLDGRAQNHDDWITLSRALIDVGIRAREAAEKHDTKAVFDLGAEVYEACVNCHKIYLVGPKAPPGAATPASTKPQ